MMLGCWSSAPISISNPTNRIAPPQNQNSTCQSFSPFSGLIKSVARRPSKSKVTCLLKLGVDDIVAIAHNKVLIAAGVSAAVGQLSKPFTRQLLYGKNVDFMAAVQAGGFPSTHSSAVVATATCLGLERGFSDSIFGLSLVYAGLVMYDAQGVRREAGIHAKALNKLFAEKQGNSMVVTKDEALIDSSGNGPLSSSNFEANPGPLLSKEGRPNTPNSTNVPQLLEPENKTTQTKLMQVVSSSLAGVEERIEEGPGRSFMFKESIGHTEVEVTAGALLGFLVGIAVCSAL